MRLADRAGWLENNEKMMVYRCRIRLYRTKITEVHGWLRDMDELS
jgi:hypothetical protein